MSATTGRAAHFRPATANLETREVECVFATGAPVPMMVPGYGRVLEQLIITPQAMKLDRLKNGTAPVLDNHQTGRAGAVIGRIVSARIEGGEAVARLKISAADDVEPLWQRIVEGTLTSVSVGYTAHKHERAGERDGMTVLRATSWTPREISLVPIPADPAATFRKAEHTMSETTMPADDAGTLAVRAERARVAELDNVARLAEPMLGRAGAEALRSRAAAEGWSVPQMREEAFAALAAALPSVRGTHTEATRDNPTFLRESLAEALACRAGGGVPSPRARDFMAMRVSDMAAMLLQHRGESVSTLAPAQILQRSFHTTSDFPALLQSTGARLLQQAFEPAASGLRQIMRTRTATDFRTLSSLRSAGVDKLLEVLEGGEVTAGTAFEAAETYRVKTFARTIRLSREALVNDDLSAFETMRAIGMAAATTEAEEFLKLLTANSMAGPTMADGNPLFFAARGNLASSGAAIDISTVSTGRAAMRNQKDLNGVQIASAPRFLLVGPAYETAAEQLVATITPATSGTANPFAGRLEPLVEPRLTGNSWYLFADPALLPTFELATLAGTGGVPQIETFTEANSLGVTLRCVHDFGCGAINTIGAWRNPGA